jgi:predicted RNA polymerase sigma factor
LDFGADARAAAEFAARASYGRLLAYLAYRFRDLAAAEDALSDALRAALETWPGQGVPDKPDAWLLTAARRRLIDEHRHRKIRDDPAVTLLVAGDEESSEIPDVFPDERLKLMFICSHPAIDAAARTPLMLQTVLGLDAARIASAFLVAPAAMGQRLTRAKAKIRDARIRFEVPERDELAERLEAVLAAIYAAYGSGWDDISGADPRRRGLAAEAAWLAGLMVGLMPDEPEARGLLALILHCEARRDARRTAGGAFVPLYDQDTTLWSQAMIRDAEAELARAAELGRSGRFQLEAAIQSLHAQRAYTGDTDWQALALLYEGLIRVAPTIGALVGRAAAVAKANDAERGLALLRKIDVDEIRNYQPYWALMAHLLQRLGRKQEAAQAYERAIGLTEDAAVRDFLLAKSA